MYFITTKRMLEVCFFQHTPTFIIEPENTPAQVTLITRPRRFGKTLGMSMLANFAKF